MADRLMMFGPSGQQVWLDRSDLLSPRMQRIADSPEWARLVKRQARFGRQVEIRGSFVHCTGDDLDLFSPASAGGLDPAGYAKMVDAWIAYADRERGPRLRCFGRAFPAWVQRPWRWLRRYR